MVPTACKLEKVITYIFLMAAARMKPQMQTGVLLRFCITKASIMNWIFGGVSGRTNGRPGVPPCLIISIQVFNQAGTVSTVALMPLSVMASHIGFKSS